MSVSVRQNVNFMVVTVGIGGPGIDSSRKLMLESWYEFVEFARDVVCVYYCVLYV